MHGDQIIFFPLSLNSNISSICSSADMVHTHININVTTRTHTSTHSWLGRTDASIVLSPLCVFRDVIYEVKFITVRNGRNYFSLNN